MVHAFPSSKRKGTPAAEMDGQIPEDVKKQRVHILTEICREVRSGLFDRMIDERRQVEVLFENFDGEYVSGHTSDFVEVHAKSDRQLHGVLKRVVLISHDGEKCFGELI